MHENFSAVITSPLGKIGLIVQQCAVLRLALVAADVPLKTTDDAATQQAVSALEKYFANPQHAIDLKFNLVGSAFQRRVWEALQHIPQGETRTYGELAKALKSSPRAVGQACRTNPVPVLIPCHRVVAKSHLGGYAGATTGKLMAVKKWLLAHEQLPAAAPSSNLSHHTSPALSR